MRRVLILVGLTFGLQIAALLGAFQCQVGFLHDECFLLECSSRMLLGEQPYRDYITRFMPATSWILAGFFATLGESVFSMRLYFILMAGFLAAAIQWFSMLLLPRGWSELPTLLFLMVGIQTWPMVSYHWDANIFALLALGLLATRRTPPRVLATGVLCGVTVLFLQTKGLATCLGCGVLLLLEPIPFRQRLRHLGLLIAGAAIPGLGFGFWLALNGLTQSFFSRAIGFNTSRYLVLHRAPLDFSPLAQEVQVILQGLQNINQPGWFSWFWRATGFAAVDFIKFGGYYPVLLLGTLLAALRLRKPWTSQSTAFTGLILVLLLASLFDLGRPNRYRLQFQGPLWNGVLIYLLYTLSLQRKRLAATLTALIVVAYCLHGLDNLTTWSGYRYAVDFPRGRMYYNDPVLAARLNQVSTLLTPLIPPGTPVFAFPVQNALVWLQGNPNPTTYPEALPVLYTREDFLQIRKELDQRQVPWIIYSPLDSRLNGDYPMVKPEEYEREQKWAVELLTQGYEKALETPHLTLYRRK